MVDGPAGLAATGRLLSDVFSPEIGDPRYLRWLYEENPEGAVVETNLDDAQGRAGHYAVVPWAIRLPGVAAPVSAALSLNTAVLERARAKGVFTRLAEETYAEAADRGIQAIVGVANANSTPGFQRRLGFSMLGSLPARVMIPTRSGRAVEGCSIDASVLADGAFWRVVQPLLDVPAVGLARAWNRESLAWRLASPRGAYTAHLLDDAAAISTVSTVGGAPIAVMLKMLCGASAGVGAARQLVGAACRVHRTPAAIHVGGGSSALPRGIPLPVRFRPSPLNLIFRGLDKGDLPAPHLAAWEFLDFDAY